ncbi:hypothetical protein [Salinibacterium sp. SWN248]|uniref:hypothetical protein n=1 Tax=Salinibacterium sp. SWN248 TaxID=2792056 RepID=UPI0018CCCFC1|nr:hypothetical protein [Salinibacterium sp. SWN248]MBH0024417.1 hypothetical protein [Salinibacterium sp. SWN248]
MIRTLNGGWASADAGTSVSSFSLMLSLFIGCDRRTPDGFLLVKPWSSEEGG